MTKKTLKEIYYEMLQSSASRKALSEKLKLHKNYGNVRKYNISTFIKFPDDTIMRRDLLAVGGYRKMSDEMWVKDGK